MELFGIGPLELIVIVVIALIILGPRDLSAFGLSMGRLLRKVVMSPEWKALLTIGKEVKEAPTKLMREAQLDELNQELQSQLKDPLKDVGDAVNQSTAAVNQSLKATGDGIKATIKPAENPKPADAGAADPLAAWKNPSAAGPAPEPTNSIDRRLAAEPKAQQPTKPTPKPGPILLTAEFDDEDAN